MTRSHLMPRVAELPDVIRDLVADHTREMSVLDQAIRWYPAKWIERTELQPWHAIIQELAAACPDDHIRPGAKCISRGLVATQDDPMGLFLASMFWGYGPTGWGPYRVGRIVTENPHLEAAIGGIIAAAEDTPEAAWDAITKRHKLHRLGPAFGTKVTYFAALHADTQHPWPLIADLNTSWGIWNLTKDQPESLRVARSVERRSGYLRYIDTAHAWAEQLGCRPDDIELALFRWQIANAKKA